jgi:arylsulfatase A-like enzyme
MGLLPHPNPHFIHANDYYKQSLEKFSERLGSNDFKGFVNMIPSLWLPKLLQKSGYKTHAFVSMPVLNKHTMINQYFDEYELMPEHNNLQAQIEKMTFDDQPQFYLMNTGETHYPYAVPGETKETWPKIHGFHGVIKHLGDDGESEKFFDLDQLYQLQTRQRDAVSYLDGIIENLYDKVPKDTWIIITSDHGELFGEDGFFGHGPINHPKILEVPFVEGKIR